MRKSSGSNGGPSSMPGFTANKMLAGLLFFLAASSAHAASSGLASAGEAGPPSCSKKQATELLTQAMQLQSDLETEEALASYEKCLKSEPACTACRYEI